MANPRVVVDFVSDTSGLRSGFNQAGGAATGFGSKLKGLAKAGVAGAAAAGVAGLTAAIKIGIDEYTEATKVAAQTQAVIKSTGGAANVTAKQVESLAEALMKKSGVDDEAIASGENLLLTFTNIRNETGKGNDIFNQATKAALDMSVALGTDMQSAAMQVGKALNDPIKGMSRLQRIGVDFSDAQEQQIKKFAESGQTMKAQKIILGELNKEFGGSAVAAGKTLPGQLNILKQTFANFAGDLVAKVVPALQLAIKWLRDHWPEIKTVILTAWAAIRPVLISMGQSFMAVAKLIADNWGTIGPIMKVVGALVINTIKIMTGPMRIFAALLAGDWSKAWHIFLDTAKAVLNQVKLLVKGVFLILRAIITGAWAAIKAATSAAWNAMRGLVRAGVNGVKGLVRGMVDWVRALASGLWSRVITNMGVGFKQIWGGVRAAIAAVKTFVRGMVDWIAQLGRGILTTALVRVGNVFDKIADGARAAVRAVKNVLGDMVSWLGGIINRVGNAAAKIANAIKGPINSVLSAIDSIKLSVSFAGKKLPGKIPDIPGFHFTIDPFPNVPRLAEGGVISSPTLAMVGEGRGREIVAPESLLREIVASARPSVRVFIGDTELRGIVRTEIVDHETGIARTLLAGRAP